MKKLLLLLFLIPVLTSAQKTTGDNYTYIAQRYEWLAGVFKALGLPAGSGPAAFTAGQEMRAGAVYFDSLGVDAGLKVWNGAAWVGVGEVTQSALDDTAAAIRADFPTGSAANTNAGAFYRWLKPSSQEIKTFANGYGVLIDSLTNTDALTLDVDSLVIANRDWVMDRIADITVQFDSLGAAGISPMTTWNNILYSRRISVTGGLTIDTTASGGLVIDGSGVSGGGGSVQIVEDLADATQNLVIMGNRMYHTNADSTYWFKIAVADSIATGFVTYDSDAQAYFDAVEGAGGTITETQKGHFNTWFITAKARTYWTKTADGVIPIWGSGPASVVTLKGFSTVGAVGSPTYASDGTDWNGTSQYFTTDFVPTSNTSGFLGYYSQDDITETSVCIGSSTGSNHYAIFLLITTTGQIGRIYTSTNQTASARGGTTTGFAITSRTASNDHRSYWNGSQTGSTVTASGGTRPTHAIYIGARNADGAASTFSTQKCSAAFWGGTGLTPTEAGEFTTDLEVLMDGLGIGQIP